MLKTFQAINLAKKHIIEFSTTVKKEDREKFDIDYSIISDLLKSLQVFQDWIKVFEGDEFGNQSDFLNAWYAINKSFQDIPNKRWNTAKAAMKDKKIALERTHQETFEYLAVCAILNPRTSLTNMPEKDKKKSLTTIREDMKNIVVPIDSDQKQEEDLSPDGFVVSQNGDPLIQLYSRVWECPGELFEY